MSLLQHFSYAALLLCVAARADTVRAEKHSCDLTLSSSIERMERVLGSIRVDKPGLARVYSANGTEFTAGQALWMKHQMRELETACAHGDQVAAARHLEQLQVLLKAHGSF
jgi:hypothetical protein